MARPKKDGTPAVIGPGKKDGRPEKVINWEQIDGLCALHCTGAEIASIVGVDYSSLERQIRVKFGKTFTEYFTEKAANGKMSLRRRQFKAAMDGNPTLLIWLGKQMLGQKDKHEHEVTGAGGGPLEISIHFVKPKAK